MFKKLIFCFLFLLSSSAFANINCEKGDFSTPPVWEDGFLTSVLEGTCNIEGSGDLQNLNDYLIVSMTKGPSIQELHRVNQKATFEGLSAVEIDSTFKLVGGGELIARGLTHVGAMENGALFFNRETTEIISATSWKKYTRKIGNNYQITPTENGFELTVTQENLSEMQEMAASFAKKGLKRNFKKRLNDLAKEVLENL